MKKEEIEQELINLAKLRWEYIKESPEYKKDFDNFIVELNSKTNNTWANYPLFYENFPMLTNENLNDFKNRIEWEIEKRVDKGGEEILLGYGQFCMRELGDPTTTGIVDKWKIRPPVDITVSDPNPWTLDSLTFDPIFKLGNITLDLSPQLTIADEFKKLCVEAIKPIEEKYKYWIPTFSYLITEIFYDKQEVLHAHETKKIILEIDLEYPIKYIKHRFDEIIEQERRRLIKSGSIEEKKNYKEVMASAIKVYRLRRDKKKWDDIAKEIFPNDFKKPDPLSDDASIPIPNPESAIVKVKQYYKRAEDLIREGV